MKAMEELVKNCPRHRLRWTGLSYEERLSGSQAPALYALSLLVVFLCLAALMKSWSIPASVMLVVPLGVIGAVLAASSSAAQRCLFPGRDCSRPSVLASKNAILMSSSPRSIRGRTCLIEATLNATRMRLRPFL